jgi:Mg2+ and Co2+ transporter CorA
LEFATGEHDEDAAAENELEKMLGDLKDRAEKLSTMTEKLEKIAQDAADKRKE